jgi:serine/threonine protein kinase
LIGKGSFSSVWLGLHETTKMEAAIKIILKSSIHSQEISTRFVREVSIFKKLNHPFITELYEYFENDDAYYIVMEYVPKGTLLTYVNRLGRIPEPVARRYFCQLIHVLEYLHETHKICHRDLKAENLLLDEKNNIRVIDFGLSNQFSSGNPNLNTACGSPAYASPEMAKGQSSSKASDIWSAGVLLFAMCSGELPFHSHDVHKTLHLIAFSEPNYPHYFSPNLVDLLKKLLDKNQTKRITIPKIKEHPWFSQHEYSALLADKLHSIIKSGSSIDVDILEQMRKLGVDAKNVISELSNDEITPTTAIYRMLYKTKMTNVIDDVMRHLTGETVESPTSKKVLFQFVGAPQTKAQPTPISIPAVTSRKLSKPLAVRRTSAVTVSSGVSKEA